MVNLFFAVLYSLLLSDELVYGRKLSKPVKSLVKFAVRLSHPRRRLHENGAGAALSPHYSSYPLTVDLSRSDHDVLSTSDYDPDSSNDNPVHEGGSSIRDPVSSRKEKDGQSVNMPESRYYSPDGSSEDLTPHFSTTGSSAISGSAVAAGTSGYTTLRGSSVTPSGYFSSRRGVYYSPNPISLPGPVFPFPMGFGLPLTLPGLSVMPTGSGGALKLPCCIHCSLTDMLCMFNCQMCV